MLCVLMCACVVAFMWVNVFMPVGVLMWACVGVCALMCMCINTDKYVYIYIYIYIYIYSVCICVCAVACLYVCDVCFCLFFVLHLATPKIKSGRRPTCCDCKLMATL